MCCWIWLVSFKNPRLLIGIFSLRSSQCGTEMMRLDFVDLLPHRQLLICQWQRDEEKVSVWLAGSCIYLKTNLIFSYWATFLPELAYFGQKEQFVLLDWSTFCSRFTISFPFLRFILRRSKPVLLLSMMSSAKQWAHAGLPGQLCKITIALFLKWFHTPRNSLQKMYLRRDNNCEIYIIFGGLCPLFSPLSGTRKFKANLEN